MDLMTGVLSESDIAILRNLSSGAVNRKRSEERFRADATKLLEKLSSTDVKTIDDQAVSASKKDKQSRLDELRAKQKAAQ
jgi:hypothetical protein